MVNTRISKSVSSVLQYLIVFQSAQGANYIE